MFWPPKRLFLHSSCLFHVAQRTLHLNACRPSPCRVFALSLQRCSTCLSSILFLSEDARHEQYTYSVPSCYPWPRFCT
ncbi:hypothetical protein B0H12DRAFT_1099904 [Mycena haematopus]|nr:hypothetical protein B0H12DRAFT_1099904 [Mycena haematopus]